MSAFKYPVGAEVAYKVECEYGEPHRMRARIVAAFACGDAENKYVVEYERAINDNIVFEHRVVYEDAIIGRINMRAKRVVDGHVEMPLHQ